MKFEKEGLKVEFSKSFSGTCVSIYAEEEGVDFYIDFEGFGEHLGPRLVCECFWLFFFDELKALFKLRF